MGMAPASTLSELPVVMAIIAVLMFILMPTLQWVCEQGTRGLPVWPDWMPSFRNYAGR
jgi:hypothetical protein